MYWVNYICVFWKGGLLAVKAALRLPELIRGVVCIGPAFDVSPLIFTPWKVSMFIVHLKFLLGAIYYIPLGDFYS